MLLERISAVYFSKLPWNSEKNGLSPKLINLFMLIAIEPCKHTFVSFNDRDKKHY